MNVWNGVCLDTWAQHQTLFPVPPFHVDEMMRYSGYDILHVPWYDLGVPEIPLDIRFSDFVRRLNKAKSRHPSQSHLTTL